MWPVRLSLKRFKIVEDAELELAPITLLIGGNNAGKSTVLQALALLAQSVGQYQLKVDGPYVDLGATPAALLNRGSKVGDGWSVEVTWRDQGRDPVAADTPREISFRCTGGVTDAPFATEGRVRFEAPAGRGVTVRAWESAVGPRLEIDTDPQSDTMKGYGSVSESMGPQGLRSGLPLGQVPSPVQVQGRSFTPNELLDANLLVAHAQAVSAPYLADGIGRALGSFRYVGPDRHFSQSAYMLAEQVPAAPLRQDDLANVLAYDREIRRGVDQRCREMFGFGVLADFAPGRHVEPVAVSEDGGTYSLNQMGSGFGQVVWIAVDEELQLKAAREGTEGVGIAPPIGIEEPELHLHPAAQPQMARVLASYAGSGVHQLLTTQSEHLLIAFLQLVARREFAANDLVVYHLAGGRAERLEVDERGRLAGGLKGFFEANEEELLAHLDALIHTEDQQ